jgi:Lrp/AsnC family transcriptional regulator for asnA, asnC and gidA
MALASPVDRLNREIVAILQENGRAPYAKIADRLGVSEGTVRNRVNWMTNAGMLRIVAVADPMAIDYRADAMLGINVRPGTTPEAVARRLALCPEVVYVLWVGGRYDLLAEVVCDGDAELPRFLAKHCYGADDIARVETMTGIAMFKNQFLLKRHLP